MRLRKPVVCFSRDKDHADNADKLTNWITHAGLYTDVHPATIAQLALSKSVLPLGIQECPEELDGLGIERLTRFILEDL